MINASNLAGVIGSTVVDSDGQKIGTVGQVYVDTETGAPSWASVRTGLFGMSETFVPIDQADQTGDDIRVPFAKDFVKDAPRIDVDGALEHEQEDELYAYYRRGGAGHASTGHASTGHGDADAGVAHERDAIVSDDDGAMTRSEERLHVGTEKVVTGRARLRKYVVTENETVTVPVTREEVRIEREPITDANVGDAMSGAEITEDEHEIVLTEERPVVAKETVPVERVRLDTETVVDDATVTEQVRKEEIEFEDGTTRTDSDDLR